MSSRSDEHLAAEWHQLMGRYHRVSCALDRELEAAHAITGSEFEVLQLLYSAGTCRQVKMNELGDQVHLTQSALSRLIARLEREGLVERCMCPDDRRSVFSQITPVGVQRYLAAKPTQRRVLAEQAVTP